MGYHQRKSTVVGAFAATLLVLILFALDGTNVVEAKSKNLIDIYSPAVFDIAVLRNRKPVIVFFASSKCILCSRMLSKLEKKAQDEYSEDLYLAKVDMDRFPDLMETLGVSQTPTVRAYNKGIITDEVKGLKMPVIIEMFERIAKVSKINQRFKNKFQG